MNDNNINHENVIMVEYNQINQATNNINMLNYNHQNQTQSPITIDDTMNSNVTIDARILEMCNVVNQTKVQINNVITYKKNHSRRNNVVIPDETVDS